MIEAHVSMKESMVNFVGGRKAEKVSQGGDPKLGFEG